MLMQQWLPHKKNALLLDLMVAAAVQDAGRTNGEYDEELILTDQDTTRA
jgi:hypothetical protein